MNCSNCGETLEPGWDQCPVCTTPTTVNSECSSCGKSLKPNWAICPHCKTPTASGGSHLSPHASPSGSGIFMSVNEPSKSARPFVTDLPELPAGELVGNHYKIETKLGAGGSGLVYRAENTLTSETIALKVVGSPDSVEDLLGEYVDEYKAQRQITDRTHILSVEAPFTFQLSGLYWLALPMELARESLRDWMKRHPVGEEKRLEQGLELFCQACLGVQAIHEKGLVHLDLKPGNLMLAGDEEEPVLKVADFGLSRSMSQQDQRSSLYGDGIGTPAYMAPEQILAARWKDVGKEADIYALGMILYELLDGDLPYSGSAEQIKQKKRDASIKISTPEGPDHLVKTAMACLEREKTERLSNAKNLLNEIEGPKEENASGKIKEESTSKTIQSTTYYHDDYKAWLRDKIEQSQIYFNDFLIEHNDVLSLFDRNLFSRVNLKNGKRYLHVEQKDILYHPLPEAAHEIFSELDEEINQKDEHYYLFLYANGEKEKAKYELDKVSSREDLSEHFLTFSKAYAVLFDNQDTATSIIKKLEKKKTKTEDSSFWRGCAEIWKWVFDDEREAKKCLEQAESKTKSFLDWKECAKAWKVILDDEREARRCLQQAESKAEKSLHWSACANVWKEIFDDEREARKCLQQAENKAKNSYDWTACAKAWKEIFDDESEARKCLQQAESKAEKSLHWTACANVWKEIFDDESEARKCLQQAESKAKSSLYWSACANVWKEIFDDEREARRCLQQAENKVKNSYDWGFCAQGWRVILDDEREAERCAKNE